jgi:LMBR1 domain-containing protein 1
MMASVGGEDRDSDVKAGHKVDPNRKKREDEIKARIKRAKNEEMVKQGGHSGPPKGINGKIIAAFDKIFELAFGKCGKLRTFLKFDRTQKLVCVYGVSTAILCAILSAVVIGLVVGSYAIQGKNIPDVTQIIVLCVLPVLLVILNVMIISYFKHPDDDGPWCPALCCGKKTQSTKERCNCVVVWCKCLVFMAMVVAEFTVCLLPLDVANKSGSVGCGDWNLTCGGLDFSILWQILFWTLGAFGIFIIPASISLYESQPVDPEDHLKCVERLKGRFRRVWCSVTLQAIFATLVVILFFLLVNLMGTVMLPVDVVEQDANDNEMVQYGFDGSVAVTKLRDAETSASLSFTNTALKMVAPFSLYLIFICSLMGWVLFILYGGIGLWTLPIDLIMRCVQRPRFPKGDSDSIVEHIETIVADADAHIQELNALGTSLSNDAKKVGMNPRSYAKCRAQIKDMQAGVLELEDTYDSIAVLQDWKSHNPLIPYFSLVGGIIAALMSALWILQICVYVIPTYLGKAGVPSPLNSDAPLTAPWGFLASIFGYWDYFFPLGGSLHAMVHIFYLFLCVWKGNLKFGLRFCGCMEVHPWKKGQTPVNAMLVNTVLVMMTAFPIVQFSSMAFGEWARLTDIEVIFTNTIENIQYFNILYRYNILTVLFLVVSTIALIAEPVLIIVRKRCGNRTQKKKRGAGTKSLSKGVGKTSNTRNN